MREILTQMRTHNRSLTNMANRILEFWVIVCDINNTNETFLSITFPLFCNERRPNKKEVKQRNSVRFKEEVVDVAYE